MVTLGVLVVLVVVFYLVTNTITNTTGYFVADDIDRVDDFERCLSEKGVVVFINSEDVAGTLRGLKVGEYLEGFEIFNCLRDTNFCMNNGIRSFPMFIVGDKVIEGDISLEVLGEVSGCGLG